MQAIIDAILSGELNAEIKIVISNKKSAYILERARINNIPALCIEKKRDEFDKEVMKILEEKQIDLVLLIGYMRVISKEFVASWRGKILNVHPSLLPAFAGGMDMNVHEEVIKAKVKETGCTIHEVTEKIDGGPIVIQKKCHIEPSDTPKTLKQKVQKLEGEAFIEILKSNKY